MSVWVGDDVVSGVGVGAGVFLLWLSTMNDTIIYHLPYGPSYFNINFQKVLAKIFKKKKNENQNSIEIICFGFVHFFFS